MDRYAAALGATALATLLLFSTAAAAFTVRDAGFTATAYATGFPADASGHGPRASAWDGNVLWSVDGADGGLYRADAGAAGPGPLTSLVAARVNATPIPGGPSGLARGADGRLYATLTAAQKVVELSTADGSIVRELSNASSLACPASVATDPLSGDLLVTTCKGLWRIAAPATAPSATLYARIAGQNIAMSAIAVGPDGTIFVMSPFGIYTIGSTAQATPLVAPMSALVSDVTGIAVTPADGSTVPQWLFVSTAAGGVYKIPGVGISSPSVYLVLDGAGAGEQLSVGPDRCVYASLGAEVVRVADAGGSCQLASAGIQIPRLALANTSGQAARVNGAFQTIAAELSGAAVPGGQRVTFAVTGANPGTFTGTTSAGGVATMSYQGRVVGTDTIVATATIDGLLVTSEPLTIVWGPQLDQAPPTISFTYSVPAGGTGAAFSCPAATSATASVVYCGWFTQAPTIHWTVTANGPSGVGALTNCQDYTLDYQPAAEGHHQICYAQNGDGAGAVLTVVINAVLAPPTITASATADGAPYAAGTPTRGPVLVRFRCASPISSGLVCPGELVFDAAGSFVATGEAVDVAGQRTSASFGPIVIDRDGPRISATATVAGAPYAYGTWTRGPVTLSFTCDDPSGVGSCPGPLTVSASSDAVSVSASDTLGNDATASFGPFRIDTDAPVTTATLSGSAAGPQTFALAADVALDATDAGSGVDTISYALDGGAMVTVAGANASLSVSSVGAHTVRYFATDAVGNVEAERTVSFTIIDRQTTTLAITSGAFVATGGTVSAHLVSGSGAPVPNETVVFTAGAATIAAVTDGTGSARASLAVPAGVYTLTATFGGSARFFPSSAEATTVTVYEMTRFVVWAPNAVTGATVQFYGSDWSKQIRDKAARTGFGDFKGYAERIFDAYWTGRPGDSVKPPKTIPEYIGVILTTGATKTGHTIRGDNAGIAIVRVGAGDHHADEHGDDHDGRGWPRPYDGRLGDRGYGVVLGLAATR